MQRGLIASNSWFFTFYAVILSISVSAEPQREDIYEFSLNKAQCKIMSEIAENFANARDNKQTKADLLHIVATAKEEADEQDKKIMALMYDIIDIVYLDNWKTPAMHKMDFLNFCNNVTKFRWYDGRQHLCR